MSQTSYSLYTVAAKVGMLADIGRKYSVSKVSAADQKVGLLVTLGASDEVVISPAVTGDVSGKAVGIVLADVTMESLSTGVVPTIPAKKTLNVLKGGRAWVLTEQDVTPSDTVFVRFSGTGDAGAFRKDADTSNAVALPSAKFVTTATAGNLVQVEINLP